MNLLRCVYLSVALGVVGSPALAAPFMTADRFLSESDEERLFNGTERAHLADVRSRMQVIQATTGACDLSAFSSPSIEIDVPGGRSVVLTRTRQERSQFPSINEHGTRIMSAVSWFGTTDTGTGAIFSFVEGSMAGQFDEGGTVVSVEQINAEFCIIIRYDPTKHPPLD